MRLYQTNNYNSVIYNCIRDACCQPKWYVPIRTANELFLYIDLPGKPDLITVEAVETCLNSGGGDFNDDFNEDFLIGDLATVAFSTYDYVAGQKPDNEWYLVLKNLVSSLGNDVFAAQVQSFIIKVSIFIGDTVYTYFSEEIAHEQPCPDLCLIRACMPPDQTDLGFDANEIYYGLHAGTDPAPLGDPTVRYIHSYYVRTGKVYEKSSRLTYKANLIKNFRTELKKLYEFKCEFLPTFYMDYIVATFARGNVELCSDEWLAADSELELVNDDLMWWRPVFNIEKTKRLFFGCLTSCDEITPPPEEELCLLGDCHLENLIQDAEIGNITADFIGCILEEGQTFEWEIRNQATGDLADSGIVTDPDDGLISTPATLDFGLCYYVRFRKRCIPISVGVVVPNETSEWSTPISFGSCEGVPPPDVCEVPVFSPYAGTLTVTKTSFGIIGITGTVMCAGACPCALPMGTTMARLAPSSPCVTVCVEDLIDSTGEWSFSPSGYIAYIGVGTMIDCAGLNLNLSFDESGCVA